MDLIQPFINAVDSVIAEIMGCTAQISDVTMAAEGTHPDCVAALVSFRGQIEGRAILEMDPSAARHTANHLLGESVAAEGEALSEAVCEVTNMIIGNAVTQLNDRGFRFKVYPPELHSPGEPFQDSADTEVLILRFETPHGNVFLNIAMQYNLRRAGEIPGLIAV